MPGASAHPLVVLADLVIAEFVFEHLPRPYGNDGKAYKTHPLGTDAIKQYVAQRQEEKASNASINREMAARKRMFNLGIQAEKIYRKPYVPMLTENNVRKGFFEHADFVRFRERFSPELKPVLTFAYYTGWRKNEILTPTVATDRLGQSSRQA
jgi:integrase